MKGRIPRCRWPIGVFVACIGLSLMIFLNINLIKGTPSVKAVFNLQMEDVLTPLLAKSKC